MARNVLNSSDLKGKKIVINSRGRSSVVSKDPSSSDAKRSDSRSSSSTSNDPFSVATRRGGVSTSEGYVLSTGEFTTDRSRAEADVDVIAKRGGVIKRGGSSRRVTPNLSLPSGDIAEVRGSGRDKKVTVLKRSNIVGAPTIPKPKSPLPPAVHRALTTEESKALKRVQNPFYQFGSSFTEGFFLTEKAGAKAEGVGAPTIPEQLGAGLGIFGAIASTRAGSGALSGISAGANAVGKIPVVARAGAIVSGSRSLRFLKNLGLGVFETEAIIRTGDFVGDLRAGVGGDSFAGSDVVKRAVGGGRRAEKEFLETQGLGTQILGNLPFTSSFTGSQKSFDRASRKSLEDAGLTGLDLENAFSSVSNRRDRQDSIELITALNIGRRAEAFGRSEFARNTASAGARGVTTTVRGSFGKMFGITAPAVGGAGVIEGAVGEFSQQRSRGADPYNVDYREVAGMGALGGVSAGFLGGLIGGTKLSLPKVSRTIEFGANIIDPLEKPSDILQDVTEGFVKRAGGTVPVSTINVPLPTDVVSFGGGKTPVGGGRGSSKPVSPLPTVVPSFVPTPKGKSPAVASNIFSFGGGKTPVPSPVPVPISPIVPVNTVVPVTSPVPIPVPVTVPVNAPVPVSVPVSIPTLTPMLKLPPPVPLSFDALGGGAGFSLGRGKKFVNELEASRSLFAGSFAFDPFSVDKKSKGSKKGKSSKKSSNPFSFVGGFF